MKHTSTFLAWGALALFAGLAALNWSTLMADAPLNLVVAQVQAPLGVVMLGMAGVMVALFFVAYTRHRIGSLLEMRQWAKEMHRVQDLADKAEASRLDGLRQQMTAEFRQISAQLGALAVTSATAATAARPARPFQTSELRTEHERSRARCVIPPTA